MNPQKENKLFSIEDFKADFGMWKKIDRKIIT